MVIDDIQRVVDEFIKRLQIPESKYTFATNNSSDFVELVINVKDEDGEGYSVRYSLSIGNGSIRVIYTDEYNSDKYIALDFLTPITLLYQLCVLFFGAVKNVSTLSFNDLLSIVLLEDVWDWRTLALGLCENLNMDCDIYLDGVDIGGVKIKYVPYTHTFTIDDIEIVLDDNEYTSVVEATFKCVEYVANMADMADDLYNIIEEEPENVDEGEEFDEEGGPMPSGGSSDIDVDVNMGEETEGGEVEEVPPLEQETFEEPQGPVVTLDDLV